MACKRNQCGHYSQPKSAYIDETEQRTLKRKKQKGPDQVEKKLQSPTQIGPKRSFLFPNKINGESHQDIEERPNGSKDP